MKEEVLEEKKILPNVEEKTNWLFWFTFEWLTPLIYLGYKKSLDMDDLFDLKKNDKSEVIMEDVNECWKTSKHSKYSLYLTILKYIWKRFLIAGFLKIFSDICNLSQPLILVALLRYISDINKPWWEGLIYAFGLFFLGCIASFCVQVHI
jgi:hypothetical protein